MKKILIIGFVMLFSFGIFAQSAEKNAKYSKEAIDYMDENGIEYEILPDAPVKSLPQGATKLTTDFVARFVENVEYEAMVTESFNLIESYAYAQFDNPNGRRFVLAGGNDLGGDGYLYKWERNTTNNQSSPSWTNATKEYGCPGGTSNTLVNYCDQTNPDIRVIAYPTQWWTNESGYSSDYSEYTACSKCSSNNVVSFLFSVKTYVYSWQQIYIVGVGWVWQRIRILSPNWTSTLSSGT
ncbi:MAG TPA: hypothetical protein P5044_03375, partial [bacterium]|nr:hypothetical protein [bacterium]